jgi:hypothetical protein
MNLTSTRYIKFTILLIAVIGLSLACGTNTVTNSHENTEPEKPEVEEAQPIEEAEKPQETETHEEIPPTPTALPSPTSTSPPPSPSVSPIEILSHKSYIQSNWYHIIGEVQNNTTYPMNFIKIVATLYDENNNVVGTDYTYTDLDIVLPGGKAPFVIATDQWAGTASYKLQAQGSESEGELPRQDLIVLSSNDYIQYDWLHVVGEVLNTGDTNAEYVRVVITLYDTQGDVVGVGYTYTELDIIPPGGTSPFDASTDFWEGYDQYSIQVQGR